MDFAKIQFFLILKNNNGCTNDTNETYILTLSKIRMLPTSKVRPGKYSVGSNPIFRTLEFDPVSQTFINDDEANKLIDQPMSGEWKI